MNELISANASYFAGRLKELREQAGLTQQELANRAGLSKGGIADLEQGRREPYWSTVLALAAALDVNCLAFLEKPGHRPATSRGRPRKTTSTSPVPHAGTRPPRGRPKK